MKFKKMLYMIPNYCKTNKKYKKSVIFSYINIVYYFFWIKKWMNTHGNKKEAMIIRDIFLNNGYNFYSLRFDGNKSIKLLDNPTVIFGIEPNFEYLCNKYPNALKIYYATGSYFEHQNKSIITRTDNFNKKYGTNFPYVRLVKEHKSIEKADIIIQKGTKLTIETYPEEYRHKIKLISHSSFQFLEYDHNRKLKLYKKNRFLWFGSTGSILKGLDLVIEVFSKNTFLSLDIVGPIDAPFMEHFKEKIYSSSNIRYHGFLSISSSKMRNIADRNAFIILPSASEGNPPGSVINMMKLGLVPVVSLNAAFDEIDDYGILIQSLDESGVQSAITKCMELTDEKLQQMFKKSNEYIDKNHTINKFTQDINEILKLIEKYNG